MFAVIKTGGKQYKVAANDQITVMLLEGDAGAKVTFSEVLALFDGDTHHVGAPLVAGATVELDPDHALTEITTLNNAVKL